LPGTVRAFLSSLLALALLLGGSSASAQIMGEPTNPYPNPEKFAHGLYGEAEAGALLFVGEAQTPLGPGVSFGARLGFDLFRRWLAIQVHGSASTHATRFPGQPQGGQLLQIYQGTAELKLAIPIGQWSPFFFGGGGLAKLSTNLLGTTGLTDADLRITPVFGGGGGVDYHTQSRHFSFGLAAGFEKLQKIQTSGAVSTTLYLRHTF
jgi:hypothetical protein